MFCVCAERYLSGELLCVCVEKHLSGGYFMCVFLEHIFCEMFGVCVEKHLSGGCFVLVCFPCMSERVLPVSVILMSISIS